MYGKGNVYFCSKYSSKVFDLNEIIVLLMKLQFFCELLSILSHVLSQVSVKQHGLCLPFNTEPFRILKCRFAILNIPMRTKLCTSKILCTI